MLLVTRLVLERYDEPDERLLVVGEVDEEDVRIIQVMEEDGMPVHLPYDTQQMRARDALVSEWDRLQEEQERLRQEGREQVHLAKDCGKEFNSFGHTCDRLAGHAGPHMTEGR